MRYFSLLALLFTLPLTSCGTETFETTCLGFSKSHWSLFAKDGTTHEDLCSCVKQELKGSSVSEKGVEAIRGAMSASIIMRNRFESELNKAIVTDNLTESERTAYELSLGKCLKNSTVEGEKVESMIEQFKQLQ